VHRFGDFEKYIYDFLVGSGGGLGAGEGLRLKLQTPLNIADALMGAAARVLEGQVAQAEAELAALQAVRVQLKRFEVRLPWERAREGRRASGQGVAGR
jgi:hypothetical protein